jgi:hypothetical protein
MTVSELKAIAPNLKLFLSSPKGEGVFKLIADERLSSLSSAELSSKVIEITGGWNGTLLEVLIDYPTSQDNEFDDEFNDYHIALNG